MPIHIDSEFASLIPSQSDDENSALEQSLLSEGCRDALVVWKGHDILLDGHNRYAICQRHNLPFKILEREFETREDVIIWICQNQLARRNITTYTRGKLALRMKDVYAVQAKAKQSEAGKTKLRQNSDEAKRTDEAVAKEADTSRDTIRKVENVETNAPEEVKQQAASGEISVNRADKITKALKKTPDEYKDIAFKLCGDDPEKIHILNRLHASQGNPGSNGTFNEIVTTGGFAYGDEMKGWCNYTETSVTDLNKALKSLQRYHIELAQQNKERPAPEPTSKQPRLYVAHAEEMPLDSETIDLIITSPPYNLGDQRWPMGGNGRKARKGIGYTDAKGEAEYQDWQVCCLIEFFRVSKPGASLFYNHKVRNHDGCLIHPMQWLLDERNPWTIRQEIIWDRKSTHNHNKSLFWPEDERIYWLTKGSPTIPDKGIGLSTMWRKFGPEANRSWHPAPFPDSLPDMCIQAVGHDGITVLDPFAGSCTTIRVALSYGYDAVGIDISEGYLKKAVEEHGWTNALVI